MNILSEYQNGDYLITIYDNGTRIIEGEGQLEYPLNLDIRVSTQCSFGKRPDGTIVLCDFCHESALTHGAHADFEALKGILKDLPRLELAIGINQFTPELLDFLIWAKDKFIVNGTINSGHLKRDKETIQRCINENLLWGIGVSYRSSFEIPQWILDYENTIVHVIAGIDNFQEVKSKKFKKILVLGNKDFGFNLGKVNDEDLKIWYRSIHELFGSQLNFDNLALEQLNIKRFVSEENWSVFYQGEESFYINAVTQQFYRSSRDNIPTPWNISIKEYYASIKGIAFESY